MIFFNEMLGLILHTGVSYKFFPNLLIFMDVEDYRLGFDILLSTSLSIIEITINIKGMKDIYVDDIPSPKDCLLCLMTNE